MSKDSFSLMRLLRSLHRDIGFLVLGLTLVFALSGVALIYRDTTLFKVSSPVVTTLPPQLNAEALGKNLHARRLTVTEEDAALLHFEDGSSILDGVYEKASGNTRYTEWMFPLFLQKLINVHMFSSSKPLYLATLLYGILLLFLALSSLGMYKPGTSPFYRGLTLALCGIALAAGVVFWG